MALALAIGLGSLTLAATPAAAVRAEPAAAEPAGVYAADAEQPKTLRDYVRYRDSVRAAARADKRTLSVTCARHIWLRSWGNDQYVYASSAHIDNTLAAAVVNPYLSDFFSICFTDTYDYIYDENLRTYVTTETSFGPPYTGLLRAAASSVYGPREKFTFACPSTVPYCYIYAHANGLYVSAEVNWRFPDRGMLRARTPYTAFGDWEKFN